MCLYAFVFLCLSDKINYQSDYLHMGLLCVYIAPYVTPYPMSSSQVANGYISILI